MKQVGISIAIVIVAVAIGAGIIFVLNKPDLDLALQPSRAAQMASSPVEIDVAGYEQEVAQVVNTFQTSPSNRTAEDAYTVLLGLRVPAQYKDLHLDLVLYFNAQASSQTMDMEALQKTTAQVGWL